VIGRGHSGTRVLAQMLYASGVFMGDTINRTGEMVPPDPIWECCRLIGPHIQRIDETNWDFSRVFDVEIPTAFKRHLENYLAPLRGEDPSGWKLPEMILIFPWLLRLHPEVRYIYLVRNPRDCILGEHFTDWMEHLGVDFPPIPGDMLMQRALSWKYQYDIVQKSLFRQRPEHWLEIRYEDFVLDHERTMQRLETFLGMRLARIVVHTDSIDLWKSSPENTDFHFLQEAMQKYGYK